MNDWILRIGVAAAALLQFAFPIFVNPFADGQDAVRAGPASQIEPAGYAFAIWGPIYLLALAYALYQLLPIGRTDPVTARIAPAALALYLGSTLWLSAVQWGPLWATMPILAVMAACASFALIAAVATPAPNAWRFWTMTLPFALYAGWTLCATFVNIAEVAPQFGFNRFGLSIPIYGVMSITAAIVLAAFVLWRTHGELAFAATVAWALVAILIAAQMRGYDPRIMIAAAVGLGVVVLATAGLKLRTA
ncbi:MAG: hypothetical protein GC189_11185 [Alphaproteobacteria bacterium]|nr:hypothetical protein [Alphaproteobacteria bacterium]